MGSGGIYIRCLYTMQRVICAVSIGFRTRCFCAATRSAIVSFVTPLGTMGAPDECVGVAEASIVSIGRHPSWGTHPPGRASNLLPADLPCTLFIFALSQQHSLQSCGGSAVVAYIHSRLVGSQECSSDPVLCSRPRRLGRLARRSEENLSENSELKAKDVTTVGAPGGIR